jgi:hypothetical protein
MRASRVALFVVLTALSGFMMTSFASAQKPPRKGAPAAPAKKPAKDADADLDASAPLTSRAESTTVAAGAPKDAEIEGRLRSPQLVYFLRRVRAEFAAGDLGHRSFMRELSDTRRDPNF